MSDATRSNEFDGAPETEYGQVERAVRFATADATTEGGVRSAPEVAESYGLDVEELGAFDSISGASPATAFLLGWIAKTHQSDTDVPDVDPERIGLGATGGVPDDNPLSAILAEVLGEVDPEPTPA